MKQSPILDDVGGVPIFIVVGDDKKSVRAFERVVAGRKREFFVKPNAVPLILVDAESGSEWDFTGRAISGALSGQQLKKVALLNDYWFDWKTYHPETLVYELGKTTRTNRVNANLLTAPVISLVSIPIGSILP